MATCILANQMKIHSSARFQTALIPEPILAQGSEESNQIIRHPVPQVQIVSNYVEYTRNYSEGIVGRHRHRGTDWFDERGGREVFSFVQICMYADGMLHLNRMLPLNQG